MLKNDKRFDFIEDDGIADLGTRYKYVEPGVVHYIER